MYPAIFACELKTSRLCARVVRGAASKANAVTPAAASFDEFSVLNGSSMPTSVAPRLSSGNSASVGDWTFRTRSAPNALAASTISAPAAVKASSGKLAPVPAPLWIVTRWPWVTYFLTVSGVAAMRVSFTRVSAGMPIFMRSSIDGRARAYIDASGKHKDLFPLTE
ncbi:hypothetical protein DM48_7427 [Burkholderia gladioli]|uniref:Uncharacterized protein n=1 Tax=Burkholderia gladioli TaxID=28095 RepID=A0AAW3EVF6_BURGA|nr:hypothetical protein DM48_7427 [Burkholderia gladioli]